MQIWAESISQKPTDFGSLWTHEPEDELVFQPQFLSGYASLRDLCHCPCKTAWTHPHLNGFKSNHNQHSVTWLKSSLTPQSSWKQQAHLKIQFKRNRFKLVQQGPGVADIFWKKNDLVFVLRCGGHDVVTTGLWDHLREIRRQGASLLSGLSEGRRTPLAVRCLYPALTICAGVTALCFPTGCRLFVCLIVCLCLSGSVTLCTPHISVCFQCHVDAMHCVPLPEPRRSTPFASWCQLNAFQCTHMSTHNTCVHIYLNSLFLI